MAAVGNVAIGNTFGVCGNTLRFSQPNVSVGNLKPWRQATFLAVN